MMRPLYWLAKRINEEEKLVAFVISPGWCQTGLGNTGAGAFGYEQDLINVEEFCTRMLQLIDGATKEGHGEKLWGHDVEMYWKKVSDESRSCDRVTGIVKVAVNQERIEGIYYL